MWDTAEATVEGADRAALQSNDKSWPGIYSRQQSRKLVQYNFYLDKSNRDNRKIPKGSRGSAVDKDKVLFDSAFIFRKCFYCE